MSQRQPLMDRPIWVIWRRVKRDGEWTKQPYDPRTGRLAGSDNPATWRGYAEAKAYLENKPGVMEGLGPNTGTEADPVGFTFVDLDHCRNPKTGEIEPWALDRIRALNSLTEVSSSGEGAHVLAWGLKPGKRCALNRPPGSTHPKAKIEMYDQLRFVAMTGKWLDTFPTELQERETEIHALYNQLFPATSEPSANTTAQVNSTDSAILRKARRRAGFKLLEQGDISEYDNDDSRADAAYCYHLAVVGAKRDQIDRLFRASKLYREDKWERESYREPTISGAIELAAERRAETLGAEPDGFKLTDFGNAERLVAKHGENIRYVTGLGWLAWDGRRWTTGGEHLVNQFSAQTIRALYDLEIPNHETRQLLIKHAVDSEDGHAIRQMITLARSQPGVPALPSDFDADPWMLNVANGTVDLRTGQLHPHRHEDLLTKLAPVDFDPAASAPRWLTFLEEVMNGDQEMIGYLQRAIGSALCGKVLDHALFILWGDGANGKGTLTRAVRQMLGDYGCTASADLLLVNSHGTTHPTTVMDLWGARFVAVQEVDDTKRLAEALVKRLTGGDPLRARRMRQDSIEFWPSHTLFLETNYRPHVRGIDYGIWRRIHLVPFTVRFEEDDQDARLGEQLAAEAAGILRWCVEGCLKWQREGLRPPQAGRLAREKYHGEMIAIGEFLDQCIAPDGQVRSSDLYAFYVSWANARDRPLLAHNKFSSELAARGYVNAHRKDGSWWVGVHPKVEVR